jgi:hypothetical protein
MTKQIKNVTVSFILMITYLIFASGPAQAEDPGEIKPLLKPDQAVLKIINGLGDNQSALLPPLKTAGPITEEMKIFHMDKNGPNTRNYCRKWVWASDRKRTFFCGANAGVPHRFNDVWEYDLASNTWVLLYEPDADFNTVRSMNPEQKKSFFNRVGTVKDGILMTAKGAPFDPIHSWWQITYDPDMHAFLWVMGNQNKCGYPHKNKIPWGKIEMWAYYPYENKWKFFRPGANHPPGQNASILEYMPDQKKVLWYTNTWRGCTVSYFDSAEKKWKNILGKKDIRNNPNCPGSEAIAAYDSERSLLIIHHGGGTHRGKPRPKITFHFNPEKKEWKRIITGQEGPYGLDMRASMTYDSYSKRCFVIDGKLWSYAPGEEKWTVHTPDGPKPPNGMLCFNPEYKVLMIKAGGNRVWVYRPEQSGKETK